METQNESLDLLNEDWQVRYDIAKNNDTSTQMLQMLAKDEDYYVRFA